MRFRDDQGMLLKKHRLTRKQIAEALLRHPDKDEVWIIYYDGGVRKYAPARYTSTDDASTRFYIAADCREEDVFPKGGVEPSNVRHYDLRVEDRGRGKPHFDPSEFTEGGAEEKG